MFTLAVMELKLLVRRKITAASVVVLPLALAVLTMIGDRPPNRAGWSGLLSLNFVLMLTLSVFFVSLTVFTARRQSLVLKRLRTSALSDREILLGVLGPVMLVGLVQTVGYLVFCLLIGAPAPAAPTLVLLGVLLGVVAAMALGVATACLSRSVEATQLTSVPVLVAAMAGLLLTPATEPALTVAGLAMPLAGPADLVTKGWGGAGATLPDVPVVPLDLASTVLWLTVAGVAFTRWFRWEPRR